MGDFKRSPVVASPYQYLRTLIESNISDHDPVLSGPPNPVIDLAKLSHDALVEKAKEVITVHNPTGRPPPGADANVPPMVELLDRLEDARRHSYASMDYSFGEQSSPSESVDSSVQEEAPKKKPRSNKEAITRQMWYPRPSPNQLRKPCPSPKYQHSSNLVTGASHQDVVRPLRTKLQRWTRGTLRQPLQKRQ